MQKLFWLRRICLLILVFILGAIATGVTPSWIKFILLLSVGGYILLSEEFQFELKKPTEGAD